MNWAGIGTRSRLLWIGVLVLVPLGCGGGGGGGALLPPVLADYYVDAAAGSDAADGSWATPFKTLTHALSVVLAGETIHALPGTYDVANGETFPIDVPDQVTLIGDEGNKGAGATATLIRGGASLPPPYSALVHAAVMLRANGVLAGFVVINNLTALPNIAGVVPVGAAPVIRNCHMLDCDAAGIYTPLTVNGGQIIGNIVARCAQMGLYLGYGLVNCRIEGNVVTQCATGVWCVYAEPDFGGGSGGSLGGNRFCLNTSRDLMIGAGRTIVAQDNYWDNVPPVVEVTVQVTPGVEVYRIDGTATVDLTGAMLNTDTWTIPTFP